MKFRTLTYITAITLFTALAIPVRLAAQEQPSTQKQNEKPPRYVLVDIGTFGGPTSFINDGNPPVSEVLNGRGTLVGMASTSVGDPNAPTCFFDCFVDHAFQWKNGVLTDLGALPGVNSSFALAINESGLITGISENGDIDPLTGSPEVDAVLWKDDQIINLGTLGGTQSNAQTVNNRGQVVGGALNTVPDPFAAPFDSFTLAFAGTTQMHAFLWEKGVMQDLGTLGGPDSTSLYVNERGQVAGMSFTNSTPNTTTGIPTLGPFLWHDGIMLDLGTLGGTFGFPAALNIRGQVAGESNLAGDATQHPFLWDRGVLKDLGTLGGNNGEAWWLNNAGEVVGEADLPGSQEHHAFLWTNSVMTDLGTVDADTCSKASGINSQGQVVGDSEICGQDGRGFLWQNGGPMVDLNALIPPGSDLKLFQAVSINDRGEIAAKGFLSNGEMHAVLLIPAGEDQQ